MKDRAVAVIGLGLIGGSLARDLHALGARVLGYDADGDTLRAAYEEGVIQRSLPRDGSGIEEADIVVFAVPAPAAPDLLHRFGPGIRASLITDTCSTKRSIGNAARTEGIASRFVGAHPLAGDHRSGWTASRTGLFRECTTFLCPTPEAEPETIAHAVTFWKAVGASPRMDDAAEHDFRMAWLSHLPQAAASSLALALSQSGLAAAQLGPGGMDTTRLAGSDAALWTGILLDNADEIEPGLAALERSTAALRAAIRLGDGPALTRLLAGAREWRLPGPASDGILTATRRTEAAREQKSSGGRPAAREG